MDGHRGGSGKVTAQVCRHSVLRFAGSRYEYALVTPELAVIRVKPYSLALGRLSGLILGDGHSKRALDFLHFLTSAGSPFCGVQRIPGPRIRTWAARRFSKSSPPLPCRMCSALY